MSVNSLLEAIKLVWLSQQEVEKSDDASLEFGSLVCSNGHRGEAFPEDALANVGGNEQGDTRSETISLLKELVKHEHHESSQEELGNDQERSDKTKLTNWAIHS